ncbi:thymidylate kinase [Psychrosphaera saromensis]|uniref:Thymidylate kinase n=1 Tax=Psychrosphaera saromensis TaxID=716813 RepID=A0A2S7UW91_9GAMM|nr:dTMP kinase [Psychrosphaera saromensis]PQJ54039.1 dTMP kinase [Psychrosphaera saromensis]GHB76363.1 thymidylate kinase [Psychrosphaera saromensis]GLQ14464.1 thymidylate kinase [Psychrosphaera saromensis]
MSKFIVVEGLEGAGKTTALELIKNLLSGQGINFVTTREPGGTPLAEKMRDIVKSETEELLTPEAELLLMYASRIQLIENVIKPALNDGKWVLGDRHDMSSLAYQGGGRQIDQGLLMPIRNAVLKGFEPDLTILMDLDPKIGLARAAARGALDRIEREQIEFFERTRAVYLSLANNNPKVIVIDASKTLEEVQLQLTASLTNWLNANNS